MPEAPSAAELRELVDKQQIHDALMRYCRGVDRCDEELMGSVYHPGATDHHGAFSGPAEEFVAAFVPGSRAESTFTMHAIANLTIELDGDRASSEAYFVAYVGRMTDDGEAVDCFGGRYIDQWERRDARWGVVDRTVVHEWSRADGLGREPFPLPTDLFHQPVRGREDLSFVLPGAVRS
jgi:hypothetical protein